MNDKNANRTSFKLKGLLCVAVASFVTFSAQTSFALTDNVSICQKIKNPSDRLSCFDNMSSEKRNDVAVPIPLDMSVKSKASKKAVVIVKPEEAEVKKTAVKEAPEKVQPVNSAHAQEHAERMAVEKLNEKIPSLPPESKLRREDVVAKKIVETKPAKKETENADKVDLADNLGLTVDDVKDAEERKAAKTEADQKVASKNKEEKVDLTSKSADVVVKAHHKDSTKSDVAETAEFLPDVVCPPVEQVTCDVSAESVKASADITQQDEAEVVEQVTEEKAEVVEAVIIEKIEEIKETPEAVEVDSDVKDVKELARLEGQKMQMIAEEIEEYVSTEEAVLEAKNAIETDEIVEEEIVEWNPPVIETQTGGMFEASDLTDGRMAGGQSFVQRSIRRDVIRPQHNARQPEASVQNASYQPETPRSSGDWHLFEEVNPFDDTNTLSLLLEARGKSEKWGDVPYLVLRCKSKRMDLYVVWHDQIRENLEIVSRIGMQPAESIYWSLSTDGRASFYPHNPISFIKRLKKSERFVVQATPYSKNPVTAVFDLADLRSAIKPLEKSCHWR